MNSLEELSRKYNKKMDFPRVDQKNMLYRALEEDKEIHQNVVNHYPVNSLPEMKIHNRIINAELFINRRILSEDQKITAILLEFYDVHNDATIFELGSNSNIMAVGFLTGKLKIFLLNPKFEDLS